MHLRKFSYCNFTFCVLIWPNLRRNAFVRTKLKLQSITTYYTRIIKAGKLRFSENDKPVPVYIRALRKLQSFQLVHQARFKIWLLHAS